MAKTYDIYKDSGVAWIGEIPSRWKVGLVGRYFDEIKNPNTNQEETNTLQFKMGNIISKKDGDSKYNPETIEAYNIVESGTIMINGLNLSFDLISQRVAQVHEKGVITSTYLALKPKEGMKSDYAKYLLKAYDNNKALHAMGRGLRATLSYGTFRSEPVLVPSDNEQQSIAIFLDQKCNEIDSLIALQDEMIGALQAYKQSVITEAVTKGLDPNAKMKDSGVEWIGEIPEGWSTKRLKFLCRITTGDKDTQDSEKEGAYKFYVRSPIIEHSNSWTFEGEGILMAGDGAGAGRVFHHAFGKYAVHQRVYRMADFKEVNTYFLFYYLSSLFCKIMDMGSAQSTVPSVRMPMLTNFVVCMPAFNEQQLIVDYLKNRTSQIDSLISLKQQKIAELKDYKKSIIYEYVTGRKKV